MELKEKSKVVEIAGRKWQINKFDARTGSLIAYKLLFNMLPMGMQIKSGDIPKQLTLLSDDDFISIQNRCLAVCNELVIVGTVESPMPVLMPSGDWGVANLDTDTATVLSLTVATLIFNISSFFDGDALKGLINSLPPEVLSVFNAKT